MKDKFFPQISSLFHKNLIQLLNEKESQSNESQIIKNYQKNLENIVQTGNEYIKMTTIKNYYDNISEKINFEIQNLVFWEYINIIFVKTNNNNTNNNQENILIINELIIESIIDSEIRYQINLNSPEESFLLLQFYKLQLIEKKSDSSKISLVDNLIQIFSEFCNKKFLALMN